VIWSRPAAHSMNEFQDRVSLVDALMIGRHSILCRQGCSRKSSFTTFNELLEGQHQVILNVRPLSKEVRLSRGTPQVAFLLRSRLNALGP